MTTLDAKEIDKKIDFMERKVLLVQDKILKHRERAHAVLKSLMRTYKNQEEMKKEWIRKINLERERMKNERNEAMMAHRHDIDELRIKYEEERENKLRDLKVMIQEEEKEIRELQKKRDDAAMKTKAEEAQIKSRFTLRINEILREEQAAMRTGVVRQKRLLEAPSIYSMNVERMNPVGMKKRPSVMKRPSSNMR